jgi:glycosyltransferase involved in cell wall biosynthesis
VSACVCAGGHAKRRILMLGPVGSVHVEHMARAMHDRGHELVVGGPVWPGDSGDALAQQPFDVSVRTWPTARWMRRLLRQIQPDLVHAHWMPIGALALLYGASPLVVSGWGSDVFRATPSQRLAWRLVLRHADMVTGSSSALLRSLRDLGAPAERTALINWGLDLEQFAPPTEDRAAIRRRLGLPPGPLILSPRAGGAVYNTDLIIRAFERVAAERDDVTLAVLRLRRDAEGFETARLSDRVRLLDPVPHAEMPDYYRAADVCISMASSDSSPRSVWEAMASGSPCILSDIAWVHELIGDEREALVVPIDERALAHAMHRLLDDGELAARLTGNARQLVAHHRDHRTQMDKLSTLYEHVIADGGRRSRFARALGPANATTGLAIARARRAGHDAGKTVRKHLGLPVRLRS